MSKCQTKANNNEKQTIASIQKLSAQWTNSWVFGFEKEQVVWSAVLGWNHRWGQRIWAESQRIRRRGGKPEERKIWVRFEQTIKEKQGITRYIPWGWHRHFGD